MEGDFQLLYSLCVKTNNEHILNYLLKKWKLNHFLVSIKQFKIYKNITVHYSGNSPDSFYQIIADDITDMIVEYYEANLVKIILNTNYFYFSDSEKIKIYKETISELKKDMIARKANIFLSVFQYLKENRILILDGFVHFRLKEYLTLLDHVVDVCVDHFLVEREYDEFVNLLKIYIHSKESKINKIHLFYEKQEAFLFDELNTPIDIDMNSLNAKYLSDISFSKNDYVLNTLLTLIPKKLIIHSIEEKDEFIHTLELIFDDRIQFCNSCSLCKKWKMEKKKEILK